MLSFYWNKHFLQTIGSDFAQDSGKWAAYSPKWMLAFGGADLFQCSVVSSSLRSHEATAHQTSLSMGFSRQEYWSGLPFPSTEMAEEVVKKKLLHESFRGLVCPCHYKVTVTQVVSKALGITYYLHCAWRPQSSGKVKRANQFLKSAIKR